MHEHAAGNYEFHYAIVGRSRLHKIQSQGGIKMKILRFAVISFFILFGLLVLASSSSVEAAEFCWEDVDGGIARLEITHVGNGHYIVNGRHTDGSGIVQAVNGNAEIVGTQLIMHITTSGFDGSEVRGFLGTGVFDLPGLNGTMEGINVSYEKPAGPPGVTYDGVQVLNRVPCP